MDPYRILVVDDNPDVRRMVTASIKTLDESIDVLDVPSAEEAMVINASLSLDLLVMDIRLPGMSGLEMVARLRKRRPEVKVILVTGLEDPATRQKLSEAPVQAYFFKPIDITAFLEAVKRCLKPSPEVLPSKRSEHPATAPPAKSSKPKPKEPLARVEITAPAPAHTLLERLTELKKQVKAVSAMLVNDAGQVLEEAGTAAEISTGSALLNALMRTFRASLQVSYAMAKGTSESLQYFVAPRQCIYLTPVGHEHVLFVVTVGYFGPDKLGTIYHAIHLAVRDIQIILEAESVRLKTTQNLPAQLPADVPIDKETLAGVEDIFAHAPKSGGKERADGYWDALEESEKSEGTQDKDIISYDQARDMGLAPGEKDEDKGNNRAKSIKGQLPPA